VTVYGDRFSKVIIKTLAENHDVGKRLLRGRLIAGWSLHGKLFFSTTVALVIMIVNLSSRAAWSLPLLLLVPLVAGYLHLRGHRTLRLDWACSITPRTNSA